MDVKQKLETKKKRNVYFFFLTCSFGYKKYFPKSIMHHHFQRKKNTSEHSTDKESFPCCNYCTVVKVKHSDKRMEIVACFNHKNMPQAHIYLQITK